ncbi:unnamed protein product [marine sediment metagenome]|uniref:Uncharacterized protein n=1 Tax=marine sediment metagenome TaxID=412755 RepID=X1F8M1_9ZZZZ
MDLHELIIKAHARAHAAELAVHAKCQAAAWTELAKLRELLNNQLYPEASESTETPPAEGS